VFANFAAPKELPAHGHLPFLQKHVKVVFRWRSQCFCVMCDPTSTKNSVIYMIFIRHLYVRVCFRARVCACVCVCVCVCSWVCLKIVNLFVHSVDWEFSCVSNQNNIHIRVYVLYAWLIVACVCFCVPPWFVHILCSAMCNAKEHGSVPTPHLLVLW
jgi:hypothetical protein